MKQILFLIFFFKRNIQRFIYLRTPGNDNKRIKKTLANLEYNLL